MGMINPSSELRGRLDQYNVFFMTDSYKSGSIPLEEVQPLIDTLRDRYDEFIMYCDKQFEDFIKRFTAMDESDNTIIILSTDHGEMFTPAVMGHGGYPGEGVTHIPLIIREAEQNKQNIINDLVEQIDIPSTILELAHIQAPSWMEGRSLVPLMNGQKLPEQPAFSVDFQNNPSGQPITKGIVAVWDGDYKLIYDLDKKTSQLFNFKNDPDEQNNLINKESAIGEHLLGLGMDKINEANQAIKMRRPIQ
jgi:arylsulfatase A-like enzyme